MSNLNERKRNILVGALGLIFMLIGILGVSYLVVAGITWLIFWCFGWTWSWLIALGIWALAVLLKILFGGSK